jgi:N-acetyl-anhydromuramyl-L-alanine amidase AmpD
MVISPDFRPAMLRFLNFLILVASLAGCASYKFVFVESENFDERIRHIVIHYTSENFEESLRLLTQRTSYPVSSHYLIPEKDDPTYLPARLKVHSLVRERDRAWHAGRSSWFGQSDLNYSSIGIELVNRSGCDKPVQELSNDSELSKNCQFTDFDEGQIELLIQLIKEILDRYPNIDPINIMGHSDIAPSRKVDPGPTFPWRRLYENGLGIWYDDDDYQQLLKHFKDHRPTIADMQTKLGELGYLIEVTGTEDLKSQLVVRAFQMRFRDGLYSGFFDDETAAIIYALHKKYI